MPPLAGVFFSIHICRSLLTVVVGLFVPPVAGVFFFLSLSFSAPHVHALLLSLSHQTSSWYSLFDVESHFSNVSPNQLFSSLGLFCHVPLKRDQLD